MFTDSFNAPISRQNLRYGHFSLLAQVFVFLFLFYFFYQTQWRILRKKSDFATNEKKSDFATEEKSDFPCLKNHISVPEKYPISTPKKDQISRPQKIRFRHRPTPYTLKIPGAQRIIKMNVLLTGTKKNQRLQPTKISKITTKHRNQHSSRPFL